MKSEFLFQIPILVLYVTAQHAASGHYAMPRNDEQLDSNDGVYEDELITFLEDVFDQDRGSESPTRTRDFRDYDTGFSSVPGRDVSDYRSGDVSYADLNNILRMIAFEDEINSNEDVLQQEEETESNRLWNDISRSDFMNNDDTRQMLLLTAMLEDSLENKQQEDKNDPIQQLIEKGEKQEDVDENEKIGREFYKKNKEKDLDEENAYGMLTSDGKKQRNRESDEVGMMNAIKEDDMVPDAPEDDANNDQDAKKDDAPEINTNDDQDAKKDDAPEVDTSDDHNAEQDETRGASYTGTDVDELRALITEMVDSSVAESRESSGGTFSSDNDNDSSNGSSAQSDKIAIDVRLPGISVTQDDTYLCTTVKIADDNATDPLYIVEYVPHAKETVAHHMLMYGCEAPGLPVGSIWNCGGLMAEAQRGKGTFPHATICADGSPQTIFWAWAKDAPAFRLPDNVGFKVGGGTNYKYLVLQVHYKSASVFRGGMKDRSGVTVMTTKTAKPRLAGVYVLGSVSGTVSPHTTRNFNIHCKYKQKFVIHPFAFRTHTHALGVEVLGFRIRDGDWTLIGAKNPQLPEAFYPVAQKNMTVRYDDILAARCVMSNFRNVPTTIGYKHTDEMCNFYIMFWVESKYEEDMDTWTKECDNGFPWTTWKNLPGYYN